MRMALLLVAVVLLCPPIATGCAGAVTRDADGGDGDTDVDGDGDTDADADTDGDANSDSGPWPVRFFIRFVSDIPESVWVDTTFPWSFVSVHRDGDWVTLESWCACTCEECPACRLCERPCPSVLEVESWSEGAEHLWDGMETVERSCPSQPGSYCSEEVPAPAGSYVATICYGTGHEPDFCGDSLTGVECEEVPFELPDPDGEVGFILNWGG